MPLNHYNDAMPINLLKPKSRQWVGEKQNQILRSLEWGQGRGEMGRETEQRQRRRKNGFDKWQEEKENRGEQEENEGQFEEERIKIWDWKWIKLEEKRQWRPERKIVPILFQRDIFFTWKERIVHFPIQYVATEGLPRVGSARLQHRWSREKLKSLSSLHQSKTSVICSCHCVSQTSTQVHKTKKHKASGDIRKAEDKTLMIPLGSSGSRTPTHQTLR